MFYIYYYDYYYYMTIHFNNCPVAIGEKIHALWEVKRFMV